MHRVKAAAAILHSAGKKKKKKICPAIVLFPAVLMTFISRSCSLERIEIKRRESQMKAVMGKQGQTQRQHYLPISRYLQHVLH